MPRRATVQVAVLLTSAQREEQDAAAVMVDTVPVRREAAVRVVPADGLMDEAVLDKPVSHLDQGVSVGSAGLRGGVEPAGEAVPRGSVLEDLG